MDADIDEVERVDTYAGIGCSADPRASQRWPGHHERLERWRQHYLAAPPEPVERSHPGVREQDGSYMVTLDRGRGEFNLGPFTTHEEAVAVLKAARESRNLRAKHVRAAVEESLSLAGTAKLQNPKLTARMEQHATTAAMEPRRAAALDMRAAGKTRKAIAAEIGVSERTVQKYWSAAKKAAVEQQLDKAQSVTYVSPLDKFLIPSENDYGRNRAEDSAKVG